MMIAVFEVVYKAGPPMKFNQSTIDTFLLYSDAKALYDDLRQRENFHDVRLIRSFREQLEAQTIEPNLKK